MHLQLEIKYFERNIIIFVKPENVPHLFLVQDVKHVVESGEGVFTGRTFLQKFCDFSANYNRGNVKLGLVDDGILTTHPKMIQHL